MNQQLQLGVGWAFVWTDRLVDGQNVGSILTAPENLKTEDDMVDGFYLMVAVKGFKFGK